jgi:hypothetical protein
MDLNQVPTIVLILDIAVVEIEALVAPGGIGNDIGRKSASQIVSNTPAHPLCSHCD